MVTVRMSLHDRALLERLLEHQAHKLTELGAKANLSMVFRKLIRDAAKAQGIEVEPHEIPTRVPRPPPPPPPKVTQDQVRRLLRRKLAATRGLGAELARRLKVEPPQISRFKAGTEDFPVAKLDALWSMLKE